MTKSELRKDDAERRDQSGGKSEEQVYRKRIRDLQAYRHASTILIYVSRNEVDTKPLIQKQ